MSKFTPTVFLASVLVLPGCGGGGSSSLVRTDGLPVLVRSDDLPARVGATAPVETAAAQDRRAPGILARSNSLIVSDIDYEGDLEPDGIRDSGVLRSRCSGTRCVVTFGSRTITLTPDDLSFASGDEEALLTHHGVTTVHFDSDDLTGYGAWMNHAGFQIQGERENYSDGSFVSGEYGIAGGDLTGSSPSERMTWTGVMVGTPRSGDRHGNILHGTAELRYSPVSVRGGTLDVDFRDIHDLATGNRYASSFPGFTGVPVVSSGTFEAGLSGNRIQGGFYGPNHAEAAGIFEQSNVLGAFGARRN